jgi:polyphenol oxidase
VEVYLTGATLDGIEDANLAHHRPHRPSALAAARARVGELSGTDPSQWTLMRQVHGSAVGRADDVPPGSEIRAVDVLLTSSAHRPLVVLTADCVPLVVAGERALAVAHAGWRGIVSDVVGSTVDALLDAGERADALRAMVGPSIGPCCYEVGAEVRDAVGASAPDAATVTREGHDSVDLVAACAARLAAAGIALDTAAWECTACGSGDWFSHRRDASSGRQATIVVRREVRS